MYFRNASFEMGVLPLSHIISTTPLMPPKKTFMSENSMLERDVAIYGATALKS